jgi:hypothetical protein
MAAHKKHVNFGRVDIFEFPITLGPSLCVQWRASCVEVLCDELFRCPLSAYEMYRQPRSRESFQVVRRQGPWRRMAFLGKRYALETEIERRLAADEMKLAQSSQTSSLVGLKLYGLKKTKVLGV